MAINAVRRACECILTIGHLKPETVASFSGEQRATRPVVDTRQFD